MSLHHVHNLPFTCVLPESWFDLPNVEVLKAQLGSAVLALSEVTGDRYGIYSPPQEVRNVTLTAAAADQIFSMWHGHRQRGRGAPPTMPLKIFVASYGQEGERTWIDIEVLPGLDDWEVKD